jgi:hypothetical protein
MRPDPMVTAYDLRALRKWHVAGAGPGGDIVTLWRVAARALRSAAVAVRAAWQRFAVQTGLSATLSLPGERPYGHVTRLPLAVSCAGQLCLRTILRHGPPALALVAGEPVRSGPGMP